MVDEVHVNIWDWIGEFPKREIKIQLTNEAAAKNNKMDAVFVCDLKSYQSALIMFQVLPGKSLTNLRRLPGFVGILHML